MKKKAVVIYGLGLCEPEELTALFRDLDIESLACDLDDHKTTKEWDSLLKDVDTLVMRAPWVATPEEQLYAHIIARKLDTLFECLKNRWAQSDCKTKLLAIGRPALSLLVSPRFWSQPILSQVDWKREFTHHGPWISLEWTSDDPQLKSEGGVRWGQGITKDGDNAVGRTLAFGHQLTVNPQNRKRVMIKEFVKPLGLIQGRAFPQLFPKFSLLFESWLKAGGQNVGWKAFEKRMCISLVDILAFADRTQSQDFGYADLSSQATRLQVLDHFLKEG